MLETNFAVAFDNACESPAPRRADNEPKQANEPEQAADKAIILKKPLDFLLPFAVAANLNKLFSIAANLISPAKHL